MYPDEHQVDEVGEHDEDECEVCIEQNHSVSCNCRCGLCCEAMIIEASLRDGEREPRIKALPTIKGFTEKPIGYLLNGQGGPCVFVDRHTKQCTIHETRPLVCRVFNCDRERLRLEEVLSEIGGSSEGKPNTPR
jgi:Fe-S-cluster containining protein